MNFFPLLAVGAGAVAPLFNFPNKKKMVKFLKNEFFPCVFAPPVGFC